MFLGLLCLSLYQGPCLSQVILSFGTNAITGRSSSSLQSPSIQFRIISLSLLYSALSLISSASWIKDILFITLHHLFSCLSALLSPFSPGWASFFHVFFFIVHHIFFIFLFESLFFAVFWKTNFRSWGAKRRNFFEFAWPRSPRTLILTLKHSQKNL